LLKEIVIAIQSWQKPTGSLKRTGYSVDHHSRDLFILYYLLPVCIFSGHRLINAVSWIKLPAIQVEPWLQKKKERNG